MIISRRRSFVVVGLLAAVITTVWCGIVAPAPPTPHYFQFDLKASSELRTRLYYSRGAGWRESESASELIQRVGIFVPVRLQLLPGKYRGFRFTPMDRAGTVQFRNPRLVTFDGRTVRGFSMDDFSPNDAIVRFTESAGVFSIETSVDPHLAYVSVDFEPILRLGFGFWSNLSLHGPRALRVFTLCLVGLILAEIAWRNRAGLSVAIRSFGLRRPLTGIGVCAVVAAVAASYPVVFLGKSYLSPTNGALLIHEIAPTIPDFADTRRDDPQSADVGAMMWQHLPYTVQQHRALATGEWPLWNRYSSSGVALLGQGQSMFGDPLHLLAIAAGGEAWAFDLKFVIAKALFACGLGFCVWRLTRDFSAAAILTFGSAFIGFFNFRFNHPAIFTLCYSPWILAAWFHVISAPERRTFRNGIVLLFVANWMVVTSGTVKEAYLLILCLNSTGALAFLLSPLTTREKLIRTAFVGLTGASFVLATTPFWRTFLHTLATAKTSYDTPALFQIEREWFVGLFDDLFYRLLIPNHHVYQPSANYLFWIGAVAAFLQLRRLLASRTILAVVISAAGSIALAFQLGEPGYASWVLSVPFLRNVYNFNNTFSCVTIVYLGVLAGWGLSALRPPLAAGKITRCVAVVTGVWLALCIPYFLGDPPGWAEEHLSRGWSAISSYQVFAYLHVILLPLTAWLLIWTASRRLRRLPTTRGHTAAALLALVLMLGRHGQHAPFAEPNSIFTTPGTRADLFASSPSLEFLQRAVADEPGRVIGTGGNLFPGFTTVHGLEGINGPNALDNRHYRELSEAADLVDSGIWRYELPASDLSCWRPMLDFLNVRYVAAPPNALINSSGYSSAGRFDFEIFRSEHSWPRAFFIDRLEKYNTVGQLAQMINDRASLTPFAAVQASDSNVSAIADERAAVDREAPVQIAPAHTYVLENNRTSFTIEAPDRGVVILQEPWLADDFRAILNGEPVPYFRVNHAFKGIVVPRAGTYEVTFAYWPKHLARSLLLSVIGLIGFVLLVIFAARQNAMKTPSPASAA